jgi:hypothetical protein
MLDHDRTSRDIETVLDLANELVWASELLNAKIKERLWWSEELELVADGKIEKCWCGRTEGFRTGFVDVFLWWRGLARVTRGWARARGAATNHLTRAGRRDEMIVDQISNSPTE